MDQLLASDARAPALARSEARRLLARHDVADATQRAALLVVSELVTNAVQHGSPPITLSIAVDPDTISVEVADEGDGTPRAIHADPLRPHGRGLAILEASGHLWGVTRSPSGGKTVWCRIRVQP